MWQGGSSIHLTDQPGDARHHEPIEVGQPEPSLRNEPVDRAVHVAADADALLQGVQAILPSREPRIFTSTVLEEHVLSARFEHAANLTQRRRNVRNRAE